VKLGLIPVHREPSNILGVELGGLVPPDAVDWRERALEVTGVDVYDNDPLDNDDHSSCVACGALRSIQVRRAITGGDARRPTAGMADSLYRAWGWDGTAANDVGLNSEQAAMQWAQHGIQWGDSWLDIPSVAAVDPKNIAHVKAAIAFLGPVQTDLALPTAWQQEQSTWTVISGSWGTPNGWGAHRTCAVGYDQYGVYLVTWGQRRLLTWSAVATYAINCEATVSRSWLDTMGLSPGQLDLAALEKEMRELAT
jgi:hypothetical protein